MPRNRKTHCSDCGVELDFHDKLYWLESEWLCEDCGREFFSNLSFEEFCEIANIETQTAGDFMYPC